MKTSVKHLSDTRVVVTITIGQEELTAAEQVALKKLAKSTKKQLASKGHVPLEVVAKHVDPNTLAQETLDNALSRSVASVSLVKTFRDSNAAVK